jgi:hypothetical protein
MEPTYTPCADCGSVEAAPWSPDFDMTGVRVFPGHAVGAGGMIVRNPRDPSYRWYMSAEAFAAAHGAA